MLPAFHSMSDHVQGACHRLTHNMPCLQRLGIRYGDFPGGQHSSMHQKKPMVANGVPQRYLHALALSCPHYTLWLEADQVWVYNLGAGNFSEVTRVTMHTSYLRYCVIRGGHDIGACPAHPPIPVSQNYLKTVPWINHAS